MRIIIKVLTIVLAIFSFSSTSITMANAAQTGGQLQQLAESMLTDIKQATWITEGKGPHVVYIFFDPNCPYCHKLFVNTRPLLKQGKLQLRWIPVGILMTTSHGKAVAMLGADDPLQAFYQNEEHYNRSSGGGVDEDLATPDIEKKLKANENLLARTGFGAVPLMLFRDGKGIATLVQGAPKKAKLDELLSDVM